MKRLYALISIVALSLGVMAQDFPVILKEGRTWIISRTYLTNETPFAFKTEIDTFFVTRKWEDHGRVWSEIGCKGYAGYDVTCLYEEDGELYAKRKNYFTGYIKLLDFKLKKGDRYNSLDDTCPSWKHDIVSDEDTITIGGKPYRKLTVGNKYYNNHGDIWVEGIGSLEHHYMTAIRYSDVVRTKTLFVYDGDRMVFSYEDFRAKQDDVHMHVVAGEASVKSQLASVAPGTLTHLEISGTPTPEDYRYIAGDLLKQLRVLDLRESSVSIIPDSAFVQGNGRTGNYNNVTVYLPPQKIHLGNRCFANEDATIEPVVTGHFPSVGGLLNRMGSNHFTIADENPHSVYIMGYGAFSSSLDTLFCAYDYDKSDYETTIPEGVKVIAAHAFESQIIEQYLSIPSTMEYIGDMAFFNTMANIPVRGGGHLLLLTCHAVVPPVLGREVFLSGWGDRRFHHDWVLCVPKESVEAYRQADGWKDFPVITWIGDNVDIYVGVEAATVGKSRKRAMSDLHGRRLDSAPERGVYIEDGKVRVVR